MDGKCYGHAGNFEKYCIFYAFLRVVVVFLGFASAGGNFYVIF